MRKFILLFSVLLIALLGSLAYSLWDKGSSAPPSASKETIGKHPDTFQEEQDIAKVELLLAENKPDEATAILEKYRSAIETQKETAGKWSQLFLEAYTQTKDLQELSNFYRFNPAPFKQNEDASILAAEAFILSNQPDSYEDVRSLWTNRETRHQKWFLLDADKMILDGNGKRASSLLKSHEFKGKQDVGRLVRLAMLSAIDNPKQAWEYLNKAYKLDPSNPDIRSYRGRLLETVGKKTLAHNEYKQAIRFDPDNMFFRDQLAEFYIRSKEFPLAVETWSKELDKTTLDTIWVKTYFWNRVAYPLDINWKEANIPDGDLKPLIKYLISLEPGRFWNSKAFEQVPNGKTYLKNVQPLFWMRLISYLNEGEEEEAARLLKYNPFVLNSVDPALALSLQRILQYRLKGTLNPEGSALFMRESETGETIDIEKDPAASPFLKQLDHFAKQAEKKEEQVKLPEELRNLLLSREVFSAAFISAGWTEAGIQLHELRTIPSDLPEWVAYNYTTALKNNRSDMEALEFATRQEETPPLKLLIGELLIGSGNPDAGLEKLRSLAKEGSEIGFRAAWLTSLVEIEKGNYNKAKEAVKQNPKLENDIAGKETLARIALLQGDEASAEKMYAAIEKQSSEAKSYLARKAFSEKNWDRAKQLTLELLKIYPDNPLLRKNLKQIEEEQKSKQGSE